MPLFTPCVRNPNFIAKEIRDMKTLRERHGLFYEYRIHFEREELGLEMAIRRHEDEFFWRGAEKRRSLQFEDYQVCEGRGRVGENNGIVLLLRDGKDLHHCMVPKRPSSGGQPRSGSYCKRWGCHYACCVHLVSQGGWTVLPWSSVEMVGEAVSVPSPAFSADHGLPL